MVHVEIKKIILSEVLVGDFLLNIFCVNDRGELEVDDNATQNIRYSPNGFRQEQGEEITLVLKPGRIELSTPNILSAKKMGNLMMRYSLLQEEQGGAKAIGINGALVFQFLSSLDATRFDEKYFSAFPMGMESSIKYNKKFKNGCVATYTIIKRESQSKEIEYIFGVNNHYTIVEGLSLERIFMSITEIQYNLYRELQKLL